MPTSTKVYQIKLWDAQIHSELRWLCWNSSTSSEWNGRTPSTFLSSTPGWSVHKTVTVSQDSGQPVRARIWEIYIFQRLKLGGRQERRRVLGQSPIFLKSGRILQSAAPCQRAVPATEHWAFSNQLWILSLIDEGSHCVIKLINLGLRKPPILEKIPKLSRIFSALLRAISITSAATAKAKGNWRCLQSWVSHI